MEAKDLVPIIESLIFVSGEPITIKDMIAALGEDVEKNSVTEALEMLKAIYNDNPERGIQLCEVAGGYQLRSKPFLADYIKKLNVPKPMRLSAAALETLAIIAYRQPLVRAELEQIRGVDSGGVLKTLLERNLIRIVGRKNEPGNPLIYGTSSEFLKLFNLGGLRDLPTLKDLDDLANQSGAVVEPQGDAQAEQPILDSSFDDLQIVQDLEEEKKDRESLDELDETIKSLRSIEKSIFPRPLPTADSQPQAPEADSDDNQSLEEGG